MYFSNNPIHLTYDEYYVLMCLLGAKNIQGTFLEENYDLSPDDFKEMWNKCQKSLKDKGYLSVEDETAQLNIALYCLITECKKAEKIYNIQISSSEDRILDTTYFKSENMLIGVKNDSNKQEVCLYIQSLKKAFEHILNKICCDKKSKLDTDVKLVLSQQEYFALMASINIGNITKAQEMIKDSVQGEYSLELINTLKCSRGSLSITQFMGEETYNHILLFGDKSLWIIDAEDESSINLTATDFEELENFLKDLFDCSEGGI